jgi:exopolysaccharide biosynthesis WecB/TagA/CpsF family protein
MLGTPVAAQFAARTASQSVSWWLGTIRGSILPVIRLGEIHYLKTYMSLRYILDDYDVEGFLKVASAFGCERYGYLVTPNADHLIRFHDEPVFRSLYADATYVLLDSKFLSIVFRLVKGIRVRVCTGSDLTAQLFAKVIAPSDRIVLVGGDTEQARMLADRYGLTSLSHYNPPMGFIRDSEEVERCVRFIESCSPFRFCFLAVGAPQQEILAQMLKARGVARGMALCIGASVNFLTGVERRAPHWMQRIGMEWLFRLALDPARLARRYLVRGPRVFSLLPLTEVLVRPLVTVRSATTTAGGTQTPESI